MNKRYLKQKLVENLPEILDYLEKNGNTVNCLIEDIKDKIDYFNNVKEKHLICLKKYRENNKEKLKDFFKKYRENNIEIL